MARKLIETIGADRAAPIMVAKVYRDTELQCFVVRFFKNGKHRPAADYETDDKADAIGTARHAIERSRV